MSMALGHFAFGAAMTTFLITVFVPAIRYPRTLLLVGGGWAMLPDLHWLSPVFAQQLRAIHQTSPWVDLFWFHRTLDQLDTGDSKAVTAGFLILFILTTAIAEHRSYRTPAIVTATYNAVSNDDTTE
ncbi:hypothetical protein [Haloarcula nitratireducens]|uniref:Uncharacterized protein n=1 Tax=Haloarcula nitratireducens TaxID=2487749 RepID=A0AAW4PHB4_9EURY|nr:hypothetical protein [Halomicroarcula nitratireducens]MBX0297861.1 hypothetical protein [Halomicroarcula nitratireducens]